MENLLEAKNLSKEYSKTTGFFSRTHTSIKALDNISVNIKKGITLAVVGESGSGKSTLAKSLIRLIELDKGSIIFKNKNMRQINGDDLKTTRKNIQMNITHTKRAATKTPLLTELAEVLPGC